MSNETLSEGFPLRLRQYHGARVTIHYNNQSGYTDNGRLTFMDASFVEVTKDNGERLLIPLYSIRIIKLIEAAKVLDDANILLRPAENQPEQKVISR